MLDVSFVILRRSFPLEGSTSLIVLKNSIGGNFEL